MESEPLDDLLRAWSDVAPTPPDAALDAPDAATRAALDWARAEWSAIEAPPVRVPTALRWRPILRALPRTLTRMGAAAAFVLGLGLALTWLRDGDAPPAELTGGSSAETLTVARGPTPRVTAATADHTELRSGNVRLLVFAPRETGENPENPTEVNR
jgi:hypothetical protein